EVLLPKRLVEIVGAFEVFHDQRIERAFEVERAARRQPDHEEGDGDDDEQRRYRPGKTPEHIGEHGLLRSRPPMRGYGRAWAIRVWGYSSMDIQRVPWTFITLSSQPCSLSETSEPDE